MNPPEAEPRPPRVTPSEERDRLLAETLAHAERQEAQYRLPTHPRVARVHWEGWVGVGILALAALVVAVPPPFLRGPSLPGLTSGEVELGRQAVLALTAEQLFAHRYETGSFPESLELLPSHLPGVEYTRTNNRAFQLVARRRDGSVLIYDTALPRDIWTRPRERWLSPSGA